MLNPIKWNRTTADEQQNESFRPVCACKAQTLEHSHCIFNQNVEIFHDIFPFWGHWTQ